MKNLLFFFAFFVSVAALAQEQPPLVMVTGEGTVNIVLDKVLIRARVEHSGDSPSEIKSQNDQVVEELLKFLRSEGLASKNIQTDYIKLQKDYNYNTKEYSYSANQAIFSKPLNKEPLNRKPEKKQS